MADPVLPFEKTLSTLDDAIRLAPSEEERRALQAQLECELTTVYGQLTPWQRIQLARHPMRPRMLDYTSRILEDFIELHGDRAVGDDPAMVCGLGRFQGQTLFIVGQQKGVSTDEKVRRNFGMAHPWGYRKALRIFRLAEQYGFPVVTFVDTPAAHPGIEAEQRGQGPAIAQNLLAGAGLRIPVFTIILSEGGSGGALGIAVADWIAMFEYAVYMICPPERCAEILWRDIDKKELAAEALRVTAADLEQLGVIDTVIPEGAQPAHRDPDRAAGLLAEELDRFLAGCREGRWSAERRQERFRRFGQWAESESTGSI